MLLSDVPGLTEGASASRVYAQVMLSLSLFGFFGEHQNDCALLFAGLTLTTLPLLIVYLFASRQIIKGLTTGAIR